jgi:membrane protease YdiL (CAAX protease family)
VTSAATRLLLYLLVLVILPGNAFASVSPIAVGWGNLLVPGLGATLRGAPERGLVEAVTEIGLFFGGTFGVREGQFTIDSTVVATRDPRTGSLASPLIGEAMQQFGLKLHMFDTFYHYQQACLALQDSEREKSNAQPLYKGSWTDLLTAPFRWKNLSNPWVYTAILVTTALLVYDFSTTSVSRQKHASDVEESLYGLNNIGILPMGSAFGEEPLFRGFIQREARLYTGSLIASIAIETALFAALHPSSQTFPAIAGGIYFGFVVDRFNGDLEPTTAIHFWANSITGILSLVAFRAAQGKWTPFNPPIGVKFSVPF